MARRFCGNQALGLRDQALGLRDQGLGFRDQGSEFRVQPLLDSSNFDL
jgi:hypothetical protein